MLKTSVTFFLFMIIATACAAVETDAQQWESIRDQARNFLISQSAGPQGEITVEIGTIDPRSTLTGCLQPAFFLPPGSRAWGKTTVGIRCSAPQVWTIYVAAKVRVMGEFLITAKSVSQGQVLTESDVAISKGDLTVLPSGTLAQPSMAIGRSAAFSFPTGAPLRPEMLRSSIVIQNGQSVRVRSSGAGFSVTTEARALSQASDGQSVQVRTTSGHNISGIARTGGIVDVYY